MNSLKDILEEQKQFQKSLAERMTQFEMRLDSDKTPNTKEQLLQEFTEFKNFTLSMFKSFTFQIERLQQQVEQVDRYSRKKALLFHGVEESDDEDAQNKILNIIKDNLGQSGFLKSSITQCHRLGSRSNGKVRPILVRFAELQSKSIVWRHKSSLKASSVVVAEFLTKYSQELFSTARKHFGVQACWTSEGVLYIKPPGSERQRVLSHRDLDELLKKYPLVIKQGEVSKPPSSSQDHPTKTKPSVHKATTSAPIQSVTTRNQAKNK